MKRTLLAVCLLLPLFAGISHAKTLKLPSGKPQVQVTVPDSYKPEEIDKGYTAESPDEAITFYFETVPFKGTDALIDETVDYLKEQKVTIDASSAKKNQFESNGLKVSSIMFDGKQEGYGDETIAMFFVPLDDKTMFVVTYWVTKKGVKAHEKETDAIFDSIKKV